MTGRLPSISALQALEATARLRSVRKAAEELNLTAGAISQQIKALEERLGMRLLTRTTRGVALAPHAVTYIEAIRQALHQIGSATEELLRQEGSRTLTVSLLPSFAVRWLIPRLQRFNELDPRTTVNLITASHLADFRRENIDVAIRHGLGRYEGLVSRYLFTEDLIPVCSPKLLKDHPHPLSNLQDLRHHKLLHDSIGRDWGLLLTALGVEGVDAGAGPRFSDDTLALQAAIEGQGVALGRSAIVEHDIARGLLVAPFTINMPSPFAYYLVYPAGRDRLQQVARFRDWILAEAAGYRSPANARSSR